jgi:outer membrane immunogenic protein
MSRLHVTLGFPFGMLAFGAVSAAQADVYKAPAAAAVVATCDWSGGYIGVDTGLAVDRTRWGFPQNETDLSGGRIPTTYFNYVAGDRFTANDRGWVGSVHGGYNFPTRSPLVAGIEVSYTGGNLEKRQTSRFDPNDSFTTEINHLIEVKGRLGYAWGCLMTYAKFGYATGRVETSAVGLTSTALPIVGVGSSEWHQGYTVGGGVEYMITRNIVLGLEYDWINLRNGTESTPVNFATTGIRGSTLTRDIDPDTHLFVARLSYKFGGAAYVPLK